LEKMAIVPSQKQEKKKWGTLAVELRKRGEGTPNLTEKKDQGQGKKSRNNYEEDRDGQGKGSTCGIGITGRGRFPV